MLLKIVYVLVRRPLGLAVLVVRKDLTKDAELLVLQHENAVPLLLPNTSSMLVGADAWVRPMLCAMAAGG